MDLLMNEYTSQLRMVILASYNKYQKCKINKRLIIFMSFNWISRNGNGNGGFEIK